ncbi:hypothetical protein PG991_002349 [Apiospora marii]|uniref:RanBD1 domain-containing protein n=1 Tax=Apiospora marii TaxID=335849 RepID=A0ABR1SF54_9PEZI
MSFSLDYTPRKAQPASGQRGASFPTGSTQATSRFRSSLVPMAKTSPARSKPTLGKPSARPTRNLFDTATPKPSRTAQFAPALPATAFKASAGARKFAPPPKTTNAGMAGTTSAELFKMRIPEPDAGLTGEALASSIPEPLTKRGTVYADQYLADKCPPDFDDLQRRQFFCILDLRRLKHAANEIFVKKDWKVNILNFAKEYEKSRGLIMLHYGLYEFKNVKPSEDVMRRWRAAHGLPEPEAEKPAAKPAAKVGTSAFVSSVPASSTKRKADVQLQPGDNTLKASTANHNKRRNLDQDNEPMTDAPKFAPSPLKSKRRVEEADDDEDDENQRNKLQKTPSNARSRLEGIINNVQSNTTTPSPFASKSNPFGAPTNGASSSASALKSSLFQPTSTNGASSSASALKSSLFQPGSTLNASKDSVLTGHKFGSTTTASTGKSNIFGYLSESSANNSGNEKEEADADADSDTSSEHETEQEPDSQDVAPSYEPSAAASTGTATPPTQGGSALFGFGKPSDTPTPFDTASKPADGAKAGGLFGRVSFGPDGEPLRATSTEAPAKEPTPEKEVPSVPAPAAAPAATATPTAAKTPGDFTFNASTTPISFGSKNGLGSSIFASKAAVPSSTGDQAKAPSTSASSIFGAKPATSQAPPAISSSSSIFGNLNKGPEATKSTPNGGLSSSIFGASKPAASAAPIFGSSSTPFGAAPKPAETNNASTTEKPTSMFGASSAPVKVEPTPAAAPSPFAGFNKPSEADKPAPFAGFNKPSEAEKPVPFAGFNKPSEAEKPAPFAGFNKPSEAEKPVANGGLGQSIFSNSAKPAPSNMFGQSTTQNSTADSSTTPKHSFDGPNGRPIKRPTSRFGRAGTPDRAKTPEISFGASQPGPSQGTTSNMGSSATLFGSPAPKPNAPAPANMFASNNSIPTPSFSFGAPAPAEKKSEEAQPAQSNIFSFGSQTNPSPAKETTAAPMFSFGSQNNASQSQAKESAAAPSMFSFGAGQATTPTPSFGGPASQPNGTPASKFDFNFSGAGTPGGNTSSFTFGGNDQGASSNPGSFTFSAGGAAPNTSAAPVFGAESSTPTPSGSFNFQFGGNTAPKAPEPGSSGIFSSQPNGASQAPAFSFGSAAPPSQNPIASNAPTGGSGIFGSLQPPGGGGTSTGANSPFPAPSSMNTTPMGGTPEPQTQDGEEAPQEQISLTTGGPGEENEEILLEVRAKATKFVPVVKGGDGDEDGNKSPWRTQGLGPLRVLKNKSTGCVRLLLRAEPRGHVAMNKALLSQFEYKPDNVKKTSIKIMTANDDGAGLETWLLQVKKPETAAELATVLEANKHSK